MEGNIHGTALMLLKRLCKLEQLHARTKRRLGRFMKKVRAKDRKIAILKVKNFLKDYGLIWVGDEGNQNSSIADNTMQRRGLGQPAQNPKGNPEEPGRKTQTPPLCQRHHSLAIKLHCTTESNPLLGRCRPRARKRGRDDPISIPLTLYSDGLVLKSEPFRSYMEPSTQIFVVDILDGFFPTELQAQYPEGVSFKVIDKRSVTYKGSENGWKAFNGVGYKLGDKPSEDSKEVSSSSLSNHYNTPKQPRKNNDSTYYENGAQTQHEERVISSSVYLKCSDKEFNSSSKVYMIYISADETVMSLKKLLDENRKILSDSELSARGGYCLNASNHIGRKTSLSNTSLTLRDYGITCNTVLYMQKTEDHAGAVHFVNKFI
uniref:UBX domain-containing protein 11 n=1 Tax=Timema bartmani TaxID=61472 RepID=A0A7R9F2J8_9NEOP|nr:unnamed protein product [Timema bartmani]